MTAWSRRGFFGTAVAAIAPFRLRPQPGIPAPVHLTSEEDHRRMLDLLHITALRRGADGMHPNAPNAANYDEARVSSNLHLPGPLLLRNGDRVTNARVWWQERRPEIVQDFNREIYGLVPAALPNVHWEVQKETHESIGSKRVITRILTGHVDNSSFAPISVGIDLTLTVPAQASRPVPVVMELIFVWPANRPRPKNFPAGPPAWHEQAIARGWAVASLIPTSIQPDNGASLTEGIIGVGNRGQPRGLNSWGALRAWAWGASRALDYFETDRALDGRKVAIAGHSRYGKAALVAMAYDARFAIGYISSSGEAGAKLYRRNFGEMLENVAGVSEYHWMAGNFLKYAGPLTVDDLPIDAHELIALCAPRPIFIGAGSIQGDGWADPKGMFLAECAAGPIYRLLAKRDLGTDVFPPIGTAVVGGDLAFRQHAEGHTPAPNWPVFLDFAQRYL